MKRISIIGDGAFGWAWAFLLAWAGHHVTVLTRKSVSGYVFPQAWLLQYPMPKNLEIKHLDGAPDLEREDFLFIATPAAELSKVLDGLVGVPEWQMPIIVTLTKGLYEGTTPHQLIENRLSSLTPSVKSAHITGAAFSEDLAFAAHRGWKTHMVVATTCETRSQLSHILEPAALKLAWCNNPSGLQLHFALRPVVSFMQGIASGFVERNPDYKVFLPIIMSKMIGEGKRIAFALRGRPNSADMKQYNDVLLADYFLCMNRGSRNFAAGEDCGHEGELVNFETSRGVVEALNTIRHIYPDLVLTYQDRVGKQPDELVTQEFPYFAAAHAFLYGGSTLDECVGKILLRVSDFNQCTF